MLIPELIAFIILGIYSFLILIFFMGWISLNTFTPKQIKGPIPVSIVIACRNEEENLPSVLEAILQQTYPKEKTEIIIVDDHSNDGSLQILNPYCDKHPCIRVFKLAASKSGKKEALALGVKKSTSELIITTDADCVMKKNWLTTLIDYYLRFSPKLVSAPVCMTAEKGLFQKFQSLEFLSLAGTGAGAIGINHPIMNNGANLLFEKSLFLESDLQNQYASGDDIFLMLQAKKRYKNAIHFIKSKDAMVYTRGMKSLQGFFNQRIRWTSKSKSYRDFDILFTALTVSFMNLILSFYLVLFIWNYSFFFTFIKLFIVKSTVDLLILIPVSRFFHQKKLLLVFFPLQILYPFYIVITVFLGLSGNFKWKNRSFKEKR